MNCPSEERGDLQEAHIGRPLGLLRRRSVGADPSAATCDDLINEDSPLSRLPGDDASLQNGRQFPVILSLAFPHINAVPTEILELPRVALVADDIALEFPPPEFHVGPRHRCAGTFVSMPEASVHKQCDRPTRKDQIWCARKIVPMKAIAKAQCVRGLPDPHLRHCVFRSNAAHVP